MNKITLKIETSEAIRLEMESIPERYQKPFNSVHEGLAVLREEYIELENEIFFGEKKAKADLIEIGTKLLEPKEVWKQRIRREAIQVAAMAARIIQELT